MKDTFKFTLAPTLLTLGKITDQRGRDQPAIETWLRPIHGIQTHGWLAIAAPCELTRTLGLSRLQNARSAPVLLTATFETEQAADQLHAATRVQLSARE